LCRIWGSCENSSDAYFSFKVSILSYRGKSKGKYGLTKIRKVHAQRSNKAKRIDESLRAPIAKTPEQWLAQPNRFDFPDVDTPTDKVSKEEQNRHLEEIRRFEANRSHGSHRRFRANLNAHKLYGVTR